MEISSCCAIASAGVTGRRSLAAVVPFADRRSIGSGRFWSFVVCKRISRGTDSAPRRPMAAATSKMIKRFGGKQKTAPELAKSLRDSLLVLSRNEKEDKKIQKSIEEVSVHLTTIKTMLYGTGDQESQAEFTILLVQDIYTNNLLLLMIENLTKIDFESRKDVAHIFNNLLRRQLGTRSPTVDHICSHPNIIKALLAGYEVQEIALNCGTMLRECFRHEELARMVLHSDGFYKFFDYVELSTFDIASDAFVTFKDLLTRHQNLAAEFLQANYDKVFSHYERLLNSENYVTRRQALKLLGELLLDRQNFTMMTRYISSADNLKLIMNILKEKSRNIQFEAFHVFKVFVANPNKPRPIQDILYRNREKLDEFLSKFHNDRLDDDLFNDEKAYLRKQIKDMKPPA